MATTVPAGNAVFLTAWDPVRRHPSSSSPPLMKPNLFLLASFTAVLMGSSLSAEGLAPAAATPTPAGTLPTKPALSRTELRKLFENTQWLMAGNSEFKGGVGTYVFQRGGTLAHSGNAGGKSFHGKFYAVEAPDILKIYEHSPDKDHKAPFMFFRVNVGAKTAEQDAAASTISGTDFMKYEGPAPKK